MAFKKMGLWDGEGGEGCKNLVLNSGGHHLTKKGKSQRIMKFIEMSKKYACHCSIHAFISSSHI